MSKHLWAALPAADGSRTGRSHWAVRKVGIFPVYKHWGETSVIYTLKRNYCRRNISKGSRLPAETVYKKSRTDASRCRLAGKSEQTRRDVPCPGRLLPRGKAEPSPRCSEGLCFRRAEAAAGLLLQFGCVSITCSSLEGGNPRRFILIA